jgi:hypothetical protein
MVPVFDQGAHSAATTMTFMTLGGPAKGSSSTAWMLSTSPAVSWSGACAWATCVLPSLPESKLVVATSLFAGVFGKGRVGGWVQQMDSRLEQWMQHRQKREERKIFTGEWARFLLTLVWRVQAKLLWMASQTKVEMSAWRLCFWEWPWQTPNFFVPYHSLVDMQVWNVYLVIHEAEDDILWCSSICIQTENSLSKHWETVHSSWWEIGWSCIHAPNHGQGSRHIIPDWE